MSAQGDLELVRGLVGAALASLETSRGRIDDLNVYPVPDGDTGTNLTLTVRAVADAVSSAQPADRPALAHAVARAALMGARGNSGVILSQMVRGVAGVLARVDERHRPGADGALRGASDAAYRAVRRPVEGTMLSVIRELAEEAERRASEPEPLGELLVGSCGTGRTPSPTPEQLESCARPGSSTRAVPGWSSSSEAWREPSAARPCPRPRWPARSPAPTRSISAVALPLLHRLRGRGDALDQEVLEARLEELGDSLVVVGDETALKVHVHTTTRSRAPARHSRRHDRGVEMPTCTSSRSSGIGGCRSSRPRARSASSRSSPAREPAPVRDAGRAGRGDPDRRGRTDRQPSTAELVAAIGSSRPTRP
jgi:hypothetical protein